MKNKHKKTTLERGLERLFGPPQALVTAFKILYTTGVRILNTLVYHTISPDSVRV